ncbi:MAG TPA: site-specific integrase [Chloroflexota bacterium]
MQGSIQKRLGKRGVTWTVVIDLPRDPVTGKRRQQRLSAPSKREAEALLARALHEVQAGTFVEPVKLTLATYLQQWLERIQTTIRPSTYVVYERIIRQHLQPALGAVPITRLQPLQIQGYYSEQLMRLGTATVALHHSVLNRALRQAVRWRIIPHNPCEGTDPPRARNARFPVWSAEQIATFLDATADSYYHPLWLVALGSGMRLSELLALRWSDIDFRRGTLRVTKTLSQQRDHTFAPGSPKTDAGARTIDLPSSCLQALQELRARSVTGVLVFTDPAGEQLQPGSVSARFGLEQHRLRDLGLPRLRFHDLRHTAGTLMFENGEYPKAVSERLGHSSVGITMDRYGHVTRGQRRGIAERLDGILRGSGGAPTERKAR